MGRGRGDESGPADPADATTGRGEDSESVGGRATIPELFRRVLGVGLSGFFLTEEAFRKALGDTLPKDWTDFAVEQSGRTREEFLSRLSFEIGRALENVDVAGVLRELLEGRTLEVSAQIRLVPETEGGEVTQVRIRARDTKGSD
jgi:hypothetical protein